MAKVQIISGKIILFEKYLFQKISYCKHYKRNTMKKYV